MKKKKKTPAQLAANPPGNAERRPVRRGSVDLPFLLLVLTILCFGLIMLFSATYAYCYYRTPDHDSYSLIKRQLFFAVLGVAAMAIISYVPYQFYKKAAWVIYGICLGLLGITLFMPAINNAKRWIIIGGFQFQPSEAMKFAIVVIIAWLACKYFPKMGTFKYGVLPFVAVILPVVLIMMLQPHTSGTILILAISGLMLLVSGTKLRWFLIAGGAGVGLLAGYVLTSNKMQYVLERIHGWIDPFWDVQDSTFQTVQSLYAIGSGGFFGVGIGNSKQKHMFISEPQNDFIFAVVCEELGFFGALLVILLFALLIWRGIVIGLKAHDRFGSLLAFGFTMQVGLQALLNIAVVTNTLPNTGISLPFFSYGGTSLMMLLGEMGIILNISRTADLRRT